MEAATLSSTVKRQENLNMPMSIQIKTSGDARSSKTDDLSSEFSSSPGTKTPNLVARLMGLDLLPESSSPSSSASTHSTSNPPLRSHLHPQVQSLKEEIRSRQLLKTRDNHEFSGTRSLPETPRISSERRSDVDHRLSLQIPKENNVASEEIEFSSYLTAKIARKREFRVDDENRSPGHYARQIVKQVKESIHRRVGLDITNTVKHRDQRRDEHLVLLKPKKPTTRIDDSTPSCSPRLRFLEQKNKSVPAPVTKKLSSSQPPPFSLDNESQCVKVSLKPKSSQVPVKEQTQKCKKSASDQRYGPRMKKPPQTSDVIRNKKEELFVRSSAVTNRASLSDKKCKKTPLSNDLLNLNVPTLVPVKKHPSHPNQSQVSDALSTKRSTQLPSCLSQTYKKRTLMLTVQDNGNNDRFNSATTTGGGAEFQYISRILKRTGIDNNTPVSFTKWYSPSHPLNPSIFHHLELFHTCTQNSTLVHKCNRKLTFELVNEILVDILKPYINLKPWASLIQQDLEMHGAELIQKLYARIRRFPLADCRVLEDIDALVEQDLSKNEVQMLIAYEEEGEGIVSEIERDIVDTLVHETVMVMWQRPYSVTVV